MNNNIYDKLEQELKKHKYFGRYRLIDDITTFIALISLIPSAILIFMYPKIGWPILIAILFLSSIFTEIADQIYICKHLKKVENRKAIYNILTEKANAEKKARKIINEVNFSKPLRFIDLIGFSNITYLKNIIFQMYPSILEIIKKYGIITNDLLKEAIEHYRFKVLTTKEFNFKLLPILSFIVAFISMFFKDNTVSAIATLIVFILILAIYLLILQCKNIFYLQYSKKTFYIKIEQALSEIYVTNKLNSNKPQFGFFSHLS